MSKTNSIDPTVPEGGENPKLGDDRIRGLAAAVVETLQVNHYMGSANVDGAYDEDAAGEHSRITLNAPLANDPTNTANKADIYTKDVSDKVELHWQDEDGNVLQLTVGGKIKSASLDNANNLCPTGSVLPYAGASAPTGWLLCNGSAVSRETYASLFAIISTTFGVGNGSTTFNIPNLAGRVPIGVGTGTDANSAEDTFTLGGTEGEYEHTLVTDEMPSHTHSLDQAYSSQGIDGAGSNYKSLNSLTTDLTGSTGGDAAHNNIQPSLGLNYIIKY